MTVDTIERAKLLVDEMVADGIIVDSVWEYINTMNNKKMYAVFHLSTYCDIYESPYVKYPKRIYSKGQFTGEYAYLNDN